MEFSGNFFPNPKLRKCSTTILIKNKIYVYNNKIIPCNLKNSDYGMYDESGDVAGGGVVQMDEFTAPESNDEFANFNENQANFSNEGEPVKPKPAAPAANPFKKETNVTTNPFNQ